MIMRQYILAKLAPSPFRVVEATMRPEALREADEVLVCNALMPLVPVRRWNDKRWSTRELYHFLAPPCVSCLISHEEKMLRFILLLVVVLGIAAGIGMWKVRQLADSKLLIKEETIFTLGAERGAWRLGNSCIAIKSLTALGCSSGCCASSLSCPTLKPGPIASRLI